MHISWEIINKRITNVTKELLASVKNTWMLTPIHMKPSKMLHNEGYKKVQHRTKSDNTNLVSSSTKAKRKNKYTRIKKN